MVSFGERLKKTRLAKARRVRALLTWQLSYRRSDRGAASRTKIVPTILNVPDNPYHAAAKERLLSYKRPGRRYMAITSRLRARTLNAGPYQSQPKEVKVRSAVRERPDPTGRSHDSSRYIRAICSLSVPARSSCAAFARTSLRRKPFSSMWPRSKHSPCRKAPTILHKESHKDKGEKALLLL